MISNSEDNDFQSGEYHQSYPRHQPGIMCTCVTSTWRRKCKWTEDKVKEELGPKLLKQFTVLNFIQNGTSVSNARNQDVAAVEFGIFAQSKDREFLNMRKPKGGFFSWLHDHLSIKSSGKSSLATDCLLFSTITILLYDGASLDNDMRHVECEPYYEYHPAPLPQSAVKQHIHPLWDAPQTVIDMSLAPEFRTYDRQQSTYETKNPVPLGSFGPAVRLPLGRIVLGRSGDNVVTAMAAFSSIMTTNGTGCAGFLTVAKIRELLGFEEDKGKPIDQFEMPNIRAVHFLLHDNLDRGYDACSTDVTLGKNCLDKLAFQGSLLTEVLCSGSG